MTLFSFQKKIAKKFRFPVTSDLATHHRTLNIDKKLLIAQFAYNLRDESFEPS